MTSVSVPGGGGPTKLPARKVIRVNESALIFVTKGWEQ